MKYQNNFFIYKFCFISIEIIKYLFLLFNTILNKRYYMG